MSTESYLAVGAGPPEADFDLLPSREGSAPLGVQFVNRTTGEVTARLWDLGNGVICADPTPLMFVYATPGTYLVTLRATGPGGSSVRSKTLVVG